MKTFSILTFLVMAACGGSPLTDAGGNDVSYEAAAMKLASVEDSQQTPESGPVSQKVIKTGNINFQSKGIGVDYEKIQKMLPAFDAYIENENQSKGYDQLNYSLTIRVPAERYDSLFASIVKLAYRLEHKNSGIQDVTAQYYDLEQRIANKKALEARYLDLLKKTANIKDILEIERSLNEIRTEIERMEGQFKYLSTQISLSTLSVNFYEILPIPDDGSPRKSFGSRLLNGLHGGWQGFLSFLVGVVTLWPFVLLISIGVFTFRKIRARLRMKN